MAFVAAFVACFRDYSGVLSPGERGVVVVCAPDRRQTRVFFRYVAALIEQTPILAGLIERKTKEAIHLRNRISIEVHTASFRTTRGYTVVAAIIDESAFLRTDDESAEPDSELVAALVPAMATVPGGLLMLISSPYARRGELWKAFAEHYGKPDAPVLVWRAATRTMNPSVPQSVIDRAYAEDEAHAAAEYGAEFRRDVETFISKEAIAAVRRVGRRELRREAEVRYSAFVDPAGGSGTDSFTLAIAHRTTGRAVLDVIREQRPPFSPEDTVREFARVLRSYGIAEVTGDAYAGDWPRERFRAHGIGYRVSEETKSEIYRRFLPLLNAAEIELLDHDILLRQLERLERRKTRGGREVIDHPPSGRDDVANAAAGALVSAVAPLQVPFGFVRIERFL
ncbi:MAG TPA: hypothetical protein VM364_04650 [Vicinamibacterales bacterium]|nr:hypothetical protein [Vicinamibacterales bacterium]